MNGKLTLAALLALAPVAMAQSLAGRWDATVNIRGVEIPFRFDVSGEGAAIKGAFFNGDIRFNSTSGRVENGTLALGWDYYASRLEATYKDGALDGNYIQSRRVGEVKYPFHATRYTATPGDANAPKIDGQWVIPTNSPKGESAWHFIVHQNGADVSAAILRIDGDTGALTGTFRNGKLVLGHFSGARPMRLEVSLASDGSLQLLEDGKTKLTAVREQVAEAKGLPEPTDPLKNTSMKDPTVPFQFSFPDLNGHTVSNTDARFHGKVVLIEISGSWCPNCHDESPFLVELYKKYHDQGLEIVTLSFEEGDQLKNPERLRAFIKRYGIEYNVLLCGEPDQAKDKLTQAVNWNSWPTTFFVGRDGLVKFVHAGFPSSASGELYKEARQDFTARVEKLLHENQRTSR
jgi:thiol-disulfide isomerase/thioredoxin